MSIVIRFRRESVGALNPTGGALLHPGHHVPEASPNLFDRMFFACLEEGIVFLVARLVFIDPFLGKFSILNGLEGSFHAFLHAGIDDFRPHMDISPLGSFGNGEAHAMNARFIDQVHNQFELMKTLKISG